ncbi:MAG: hypothetical protein JWO82_4239, partial [Akkermansiaceae bacterium]|nr:hypothetical protein [Akkermansiaceae bacterium]
MLALAPLTSFLLTAPLLHAAEPARGGATAEKELSRRGERVTEARNLLTGGDEAYRAGKWQEAATAYARAHDLLPDAPVTAELRSAATERYALASIENAKNLSRLGDVAGAKLAVEGVLVPAMAPNHPGALAELAKLNDPIRTNPALTKEHAANVEEVRLLLYKAEGAYNLGKYDEAHTVYEDVLRTDPYNTAARRGMEQVNQAKAQYSRAAYDDTRAEMLADVDGAWELKVPPNIVPPEQITGFQGDASELLLAKKLKAIVLPLVDFDNVSLEEAIDFLRAQATKLDTFSTDPKNKGINFVLALGPADSPAAKAIQAQKINLQLRNVPLADTLKFINDITHTSYFAQGYAVTITPAGAASGEILSRTFNVPPDFLSAAGAAAGGEPAADADPFAPKKAAEGLAARRISAVDVLKAKGIPFPEGASASFNKGSSTLRVSNTTENLQLVDEFIGTLADTAPVNVVVEVKIIRTQETRLQELDFDWLLDPSRLSGSGRSGSFLSGGTGNDPNLADIPAVNPSSPNSYSVTSGNRSGTTAINNDSLDGLIANRDAGFAPPDARAPGALRVFGSVNNSTFQTVMRGLDQKKGVSLTACPSVTVRSGQAAKIEVSRELIYPTEYEPPKLPNSVLPTDIVDSDGFIINQVQNSSPITPAHPTSFATRPVGVVLDVLPTASASHDLVDLSVKPNVTDFDGFVNFGTPITSPGTNSLTGLGNSVLVLSQNEILMPVFSVLKAESNLSVADGATLVIGGLLQEKTQKVQDHTPILGD